MDTDDLLKRLERDGVENLWVIYHDYSGRSAAKTVPIEGFASAVERGVVFAVANLSFRLGDHQSEGATFLADSGDFFALPVPETYSLIPYHTATARVYTTMRKDDGAVWDGCPRTRLLKLLNDYAAAGLSIKVGLEPEFMLFEQIGENEYRPADKDGMFVLAGLDRHYPLWDKLIRNLRDMGVTIEQLGKEYGPGQYEGTTLYDSPLKAIDDYLTFKEVLRACARDAGYIASFMPKPYEHLPGNGLHLHISLWNEDGTQDLTPGARDDIPLSTTGEHFVAGLLTHARALTGVGCPIANSYKRLQPGSWAPAHICWGVGNRAALVRVPGMGTRRHIEFRSGDNAANPFIHLTAVLAAGLDGIINQAQIPPPANDDVGHLSNEEAKARGFDLLPRSLSDAMTALEDDAVVCEGLGSIISTEFLKIKRSEYDAYKLHVHPWERQIYLEAL